MGNGSDFPDNYLLGVLDISTREGNLTAEQLKLVPSLIENLQNYVNVDKALRETNDRLDGLNNWLKILMDPNAPSPTWESMIQFVSDNASRLNNDFFVGTPNYDPEAYSKFVQILKGNITDPYQIKEILIQVALERQQQLNQFRMQAYAGYYYTPLEMDAAMTSALLANQPATTELAALANSGSAGYFAK